MSLSMPLSLGIHPGKNQQLRALIADPALLVAPGAFDCLTIRLAEQAGCKAAYMTGSGVSITRLGAPDVALLSFAEIVDQAKRMADVTTIPIIADADTGYGGPLNVIRTVREFERAGISGIQIEDQQWPKRCGHEPGRKIVSTEEMVGRIKAAVDTRHDPNVVIIARTDARSDLGIDAAIERSQRYAEAGADVCFLESPESADEMRLLNQQVKIPTLANLVEGGRTPMLPVDQLTALGYSIAIFPNSMTRVIASVGKALYEELVRKGSSAAFSDRMVDHRSLWNLFEYPAFMELESRYVDPAAAVDGIPGLKP